MTSGMNAAPPLWTQLNDAIRDVYECAGMEVTAPVRPEAESEDYGACRFGLDGHAIAFRVARTTPTKIGQFVTIWKRPTAGGEIAPLDDRDGVEFVVIGVADDAHRGQFIFNRTLLVAKGIMSSDGKGGKRAVRVYPPWWCPTAKDAIRAQHWQTQRFLPLAPDGRAQAPERVRELFQP